MNDNDEAIAYLRHAVDRGWLWCGNCSGNKCMSCVLREYHDECENDCPDCCEPIGNSNFGAHLRGVLHEGWDK